MVVREEAAIRMCAALTLYLLFTNFLGMAGYREDLRVAIPTDAQMGQLRSEVRISAQFTWWVPKRQV